MAEIREPSVTVVLLGHFNPLIFSPEWLGSNGIIGPDEATTARETGVEIMVPNYVSINLGSMKLVVEEQRFLLIVGDEPLIRARDFAVSCFHMLRHTPIYALGLNYNVNIFESDRSRWDRFGDKLAPKEPWGDFMTSDTGERRGGLRQIVLDRQGTSNDPFAYVRLTISVPENTSSQQGIIGVNNHFNLGDAAHPQSGAEAFRLIEAHWDDAMDRSLSLVETIKDMANAA